MAEPHPISTHHRFQDLTGKVVGRLTVLGHAGRDSRGHNLWLCRCECGAEKTLPTSSFTRVRSCGCLRREVSAETCSKHGLCGSAIWWTWSHMKARCYQPSHRDYHRYGGRGIRVCDRWRSSFEDFLADMGVPPSPQHSIDRINNEGHYEPGNCRWATDQQQSRNRRTNRLITFLGETLPLAAWAERLGIRDTALAYRLAHWSLEKALTMPAINTGVRARKQKT